MLRTWRDLCRLVLVFRSVAASIMFDWNDQDQVGETIWDELNENEDHLVPYAKDSGEHHLSGFEECSKKQKNDDNKTFVQSAGQSSGTKNSFQDSDMENRLSLNASEDQSGQKLDMDAWPDLPTLNTELTKGALSSLNKSFSSLADGTVQLDCEPELFKNAGEEKENDSFLDCDWASIGDFDDLDRMFRSESIFGHDIVANVGEFLSSSEDVIENTVQSIPMPDIPLRRDEPSDQGGSPFQLVEHSCGKRKVEDKTTDAVEAREEAFCQTTHSNQLMEKDERKQKLLKSRRKAEERSKNRTSQILNNPWPHNISQNQPFLGQNVHPFVISPSQAVLSPTIGQQSKVSGGGVQMENIGPLGQIMYPHYGYPANPFAGIPILQPAQGDRSGKNETSIGHNSLISPNTPSMVPEVVSKPLAMTPQEKMEKLRRRQQVQAMLAIQQQQQQFDHQISSAQHVVPHDSFQRKQIQDDSNNDTATKEYENKLPPSAQNLLLQHDDYQRFSALTDDDSLEKTIYYQLQAALRELDIRVRLCIRDSLFRLATSSMERQNAGDRTSTNKSTKDEHDVSLNEEPSIGKRPARLLDTETYTNPIDRTVAHLLFHRPLESYTRSLNDEMPHSPTLHNPESKPPVYIQGSMSEGEPDSFGELELQHSQSK